jgi:hypothetical protein
VVVVVVVVVLPMLLLVVVVLVRVPPVGLVPAVLSLSACRPY